MTSADPLARLMAEVRASAKYAHVCEPLVAAIGARELTARGSLKEAVKATKRKLHQVGAAYVAQPAQYAAWLAALRQAATPDERREACRRILASHASSRERLAILERLYAETLAGLGPVSSVLDLACGLNPLATPWMPLTSGARYVAVDIYTDLAAFLGEALPLLDVQGEAHALDVLGMLPDWGAFDLVLMLKAIPCLEQLDRAATLRLLEAAPSPRVLVSFPAASLGGRDRGMPAHYAAHLAELTAGRPWRVQRWDYASEVVFLITKGA